MNDKNTRSKRLKLNTFTSLVNQIITIICGFILPRLILTTYGSEVNGLINSIAQFLQIIAFLELGVGAVVQSALYKPLANKDDVSISKIISSAQKFFSKLAIILMIYVAVLMVVYPFITKQEFGWMYTALLIFSISISSFSQYYFGVVDMILVRADQRGYIQYITQLTTVILNTFACVILIVFGASIHFVKLTTSLIYLIRPFVVRTYVNKHYHINRKIKYDGEPIKQKWNGVAQHIAAVVLDGTDNIVLTIFSTLSNVSVYSVYHLVIYGVKNLFLSLTGGIQSLIGELWAKQELDTLKKTFGWFEWLMHTGAVFVFGCTGVLILPFVSVYTESVSDVNYLQPMFAIILTLAHAGHCLRLPYNVMILAGGHYKQTQNNYIIAAIINIVVSIFLVITSGLVGVAVGTLVAMIYQTIYIAIYVSKNLVKWPIKNFIKQVLVDCLTVLVAVAATSWVKLYSIDYLSWIMMAITVAIIWILVMLPINAIFYKEYILNISGKWRRKNANK